MAAYKELCLKCRTFKRNTNKRKLEKGFGACACNSIKYSAFKTIKLKLEECRQMGESEQVKFTIMGNPKVKKNSQRIVMKGIRPSEAYEIWAGQVIYQLKKQMASIPGLEPYIGPFHIEAHYFRESRVKADLSNLHEGIQDCLTMCGFWIDDDGVESHDGSRKHYDKDNPRLEITIRKFKV